VRSRVCGWRQQSHTGGTAEPHGRIRHDPPAVPRHLKGVETEDEIRRHALAGADAGTVGVGGAERLVLDGATRLLDLPAEEAPVWLMPYEPKSSERYGYAARYLLAEFGCCGYAVSWLTPEGIAPASLRNLPEGANCHFVAVKREAGMSA